MSYIYKVVHTTARYSHSWIKPEGYDTGVSVYNCITKTKVPLIVSNKDLVTWYTCGPTVYAPSHIGHGSCFVKLDILQRILRKYFRLNLLTVMNITDVDDKIIKKSRDLKISETLLTQQYEKEFFDDLNSLKVTRPNIVLRVTEHMPQITRFIKTLLDKKHAYIDKDGSVVFDIKSSNFYYGKLQNIRSKKSNEDDEKVLTNFTIWKRAKENELFWDAEFGPGRPGWHTECSALAGAIFGKTIDIHAGGIDLRFPHHENEEVQCCAAFEKPQWVNYWFHTGHLLHDSRKMSKSVKNTTGIKEMLQICDSDTFRVMCLMSHYRNSMEFNIEYAKTAEDLIKSYKNFISSCNACVNGKVRPVINSEILYQQLKDAIGQTNNALADDFDTASCIKTIHLLMTTVNKMISNTAGNSDAQLNDLGILVAIMNFIVNMFDIFGIDLVDEQLKIENSDFTAEILNLLTEYRQDVRALAIERKDNDLLHLCDEVRNNLSKIGVSVKDHGKLSSWSKL